jgi:PAS domain S-box-containing protein
VPASLLKFAVPPDSAAASSHADERFDEAAERYRQLAELQGDFLSLATPEGELLYVNAAYVRMHGAEPLALIGCNLFDFVPDEQRPALKAHLERALSERKAVQATNQVRTASGEWRWVQWTNLAYAGRDGGLMLHSVGRDIQAQVETEARLKESEARFRLLAEASPDVVVALDCNLVRTYVSPASLEVFGFAPEELIGGRIGLSAHPDDAPRLLEALTAMLAGKI